MPIPSEIVDQGVDVWDQRMHAMVQIFGASLIWEIGLQRLGYPPIWACTNFEIDAVDAAIRTHLSGEKIDVIEFEPHED